MLLREHIYRKSRGTKKIRKTVRSRLGEFPLMDKKLAEWVKATRKLGIPVETFMLEMEGTRLMKELYPEQFDRNGNCKFGFTSG